MRKDVKQAIEDGVVLRRKILQDLPLSQRTALLEELFSDFFHGQHLLLQKWSAITGQTAQVDTGYISQFIASIVLGEPGQGFRGKGDDLVDGSEVKSAANISGVDRPRWNHSLGTIADDEKRRAEGKKTLAEEYLESPYLFYVLVDRVFEVEEPKPVRVRAWVVDVQKDVAWRTLIDTFLEHRAKNTYNLQLHPPVGYSDDLVINTLGNLDFSEIKVLEAQIHVDQKAADGNARIEWVKELTDNSIASLGQARPVPYVKDKERKSRLTGASDIVADISALSGYWPDFFDDATAGVMDELVLDGVPE